MHKYCFRACFSNFTPVGNFDFISPNYGQYHRQRHSSFASSIHPPNGLVDVAFENQFTGFEEILDQDAKD